METDHTHNRIGTVLFNIFLCREVLCFTLRGAHPNKEVLDVRMRINRQCWLIAEGPFQRNQPFSELLEHRTSSEALAGFPTFLNINFSQPPDTVPNITGMGQAC